MAVLRFKNSNGQMEEFKLHEASRITIGTDEISEPEVKIGSGKENNLVLPSIYSYHAALTRPSGSWVLIDKTGRDTFINNAKVTMLKVLRHGDKIRLGKIEIEYAEIKVENLENGSQEIGKTCPICTEKSKEGDEIILCPRCSALHHRNCWFSIERCACGYETILNEQLDSYSRLINKECSCGKVFKRRDKVVYCPECKTPYHSSEKCWFGMNKCAKCGFVRQKRG